MALEGQNVHQTEDDGDVGLGLGLAAEPALALEKLEAADELAMKTLLVTEAPGAVARGEGVVKREWVTEALVARLTRLATDKAARVLSQAPAAGGDADIAAASTAADRGDNEALAFELGDPLSPALTAAAGEFAMTVRGPVRVARLEGIVDWNLARVFFSGLLFAGRATSVRDLVDVVDETVVAELEAELALGEGAVS